MTIVTMMVAAFTALVVSFVVIIMVAAAPTLFHNSCSNNRCNNCCDHCGCSSAFHLLARLSQGHSSHAHPSQQRGRQERVAQDALLGGLGRVAGPSESRADRPAADTCRLRPLPLVLALCLLVLCPMSLLVVALCSFARTRSVMECQSRSRPPLTSTRTWTLRPVWLQQ